MISNVFVFFHIAVIRVSVHVNIFQSKSISMYVTGNLRIDLITWDYGLILIGSLRITT